MSILNDREIRALCLPETHVHTDTDCYLSRFNGSMYNCLTGEVLVELPTDDETLASMKFVPVDSRPKMITPFCDKLVEKGKISYGLSSFGYDATLGNTLKIAKQTNVEGMIFDPKNVNPDIFEEHTGPVFTIPPHGFALGYTNEIFDMPEDVLSICMAKSTYARGALIVGVTPLEPGWRGQVTLELSNTLDIPILVYANEGICQFLFFKGSNCPEVTYASRNGKYMDQRGIVLSRVVKE